MKPGAEQSFLYGNHVMKSGLGRITENTMQYQGVVVYSMTDVPLVSSGTKQLFLEDMSQGAMSNRVKFKRPIMLKMHMRPLFA